MSTTATGECTVPASRQRVWESLTRRAEYCEVCDVSYRYPDLPADDGDAGPLGPGARFLCAPGREVPTDGGTARRGEVVEWQPPSVLQTRLELTPETWTTRIELTEVHDRATTVTVTITHVPIRQVASLLLRARQRRVIRRLVQQTVDAELAKLPEHLACTSGGSL